MNKTLANPYYLFSFQHIASKERISFIPQVITSNVRYDKFRFVEAPTTNLSVTPPQVFFEYIGQYYYSIYEQISSGNTDPSLAYNKLESGRAWVIVGNDDLLDCLYEPYISNDEDFAQVIYVSEEEEQCINPPITPSPTPSVTSTATPTPSVTPTITPTSSLTPTVTPTVTNTPSNTSTVTPTPSSTPFSPALFSNLVEWWRADSGVGFDADLGVTGWTGYNGNILTAFTASRRAQYISSDSNFGNKPSLLFNSGNTNQDWGYLRPAFSGNTSKTWLMVSRLIQKVGADEYNVLFSQGPPGSPRTAIFARTSSNQYNCFNSDPSTETLTGTTAVNDTYQFTRISYNRTAGTNSFFISTANTFQNLLTTNTLATNLNFTVGNLNICGYSDSLGVADSPRMSVVEFIQINGIPSNAELTNYSNYLNSKYGI